MGDEPSGGQGHCRPHPPKSCVRVYLGRIWNPTLQAESDAEDLWSLTQDAALAVQRWAENRDRISASQAFDKPQTIFLRSANGELQLLIDERDLAPVYRVQSWLLKRLL